MRVLLCIFLLFGHKSFGQTIIRGASTISINGIYSDSVNNSPNIAFNDRIKLKQIDKSSAKIDIRLYRLHSLSNTKNLRRIFMIDSTWGAVEYNEWNNPVKIKRYRLKAKAGFDSLFIQLLNNNIFTLPNQTDLKNKMRKFVGFDDEGYAMLSKISLLDGESYTLEIKVGKNFRVYQFDNPESYSAFYDDISELKDFLNMVQAFDKNLERK